MKIGWDNFIALKIDKTLKFISALSIFRAAMFPLPVFTFANQADKTLGMKRQIQRIFTVQRGAP